MATGDLAVLDVAVSAAAPGSGRGAAAAPATVDAVPGRVSIVLAACNCHDTIADAVASCLDQTHHDVEVIVVDDGSTDATAQVLERFGGSIRVIHQRNGGLAAARNTGARAATGEFVAWMDGDDIARPERLLVEAGVLASKPELALVCSDFSAFVTGAPDFDPSHIDSYYRSVGRQGGLAGIYASSGTIEAFIDARRTSIPIRWGDVYERLLWGNFVHPPTVMVRRRVFDEVGFFDESLRHNSDYELIIRIARSGPFAFVDAPLLRYRRSAAQMSQAFGSKVALETARILERIRRVDPALYARNQPLIERRIAEALIGAAESIGVHDRRQALWLLARGLRSRVMPARALRAFAKILLSGAAIATLKRVGRRAAAAG